MFNLSFLCHFDGKYRTATETLVIISEKFQQRFEQPLQVSTYSNLEDRGLFTTSVNTSESVNGMSHKIHCFINYRKRSQTNDSKT